MDPREVRDERIGLGGAAAILGRSASTVRRYMAEGRLSAERTDRGGYSLLLSEVEELARALGSGGANESGGAEEEEIRPHTARSGLACAAYDFGELVRVVGNARQDRGHA